MANPSADMATPCLLIGLRFSGLKWLLGYIAHTQAPSITFVTSA